MQGFYDELAPYYHLLYPDWEESMARQSRGLAHVLGDFGVPAGSSILDAACGIGTQSIGLAQRGYEVAASDIAPAAVERARAEAERRGLTITFQVADLRTVSRTIAGPFAAVIACDNAIPHLLSDAEIETAFAECRRVLAPGGVLIISVRDYATIERRTPDRHAYGTRTIDGCTYAAEQIWEWEGIEYMLTLRLTEQCGAAAPVVREFHSRYYAVEIPTLERLLRAAGFAEAVRRDEDFFQPLLVAVNRPAG
ncbi:MAG TPA: methyltransferase domain-containing protein [Gemmatimonadaceae bacterium]|nr:methyltransferase domain-containing protein [Gemmatimonadaceae bacterium]